MSSMMFSSPAVRPYSQENAENVVKKPTHLLSRKPFLDRGVNSKTPFKSPRKGSSSKTPFKSPKKVLKPAENLFRLPQEIQPVLQKVPDLELFEDMCTFKEDDVDDFSDIWPTKYDDNYLVNNLREYCNACSTPPPEFKIDEVFFELAPMEELDIAEDDFGLTKFSIDSLRMEEPEIELPHIDFDEFDDSLN